VIRFVVIFAKVGPLANGNGAFVAIAIVWERATFAIERG
jgi:hypothetical protein